MRPWPHSNLKVLSRSMGEDGNRRSSLRGYDSNATSEILTPARFILADVLAAQLFPHFHLSGVAAILVQPIVIINILPQFRAHSSRRTYRAHRSGKSEKKNRQ
jgi:hypothetical protein